jgi:hypothetical protein
VEKKETTLNEKSSSVSRAAVYVLLGVLGIVGLFAASVLLGAAVRVFILVSGL